MVQIIVNSQTWVILSIFIHVGCPASFPILRIRLISESALILNHRKDPLIFMYYYNMDLSSTTRINQIMNFADCIFQQVQKYHTKPSDILILIFSGIVALATLVIIGQNEYGVILNEHDKTQPNLIISYANIIILIALIFVIFYVGRVIPKTNDRINLVEHAIIQNHTMIDSFTRERRETILTLIKEILHSKSSLFPQTEIKFDELMGLLNPKTLSHTKDALGNIRNM